ncbi:unnamed protein product [Prunus armeniaca]|uniref:Uncharacterized protein n=1 Tax=Prunus armeniaca TaxID=36596 RepID=A0A6J5Y3W2_PRUAR|nr:unnamed protein product [Prunus armeniaca]CAB4319232.1 unnamed protein product [Prunus armeniaca]
MAFFFYWKGLFDGRHSHTQLPTSLSHLATTVDGTASWSHRSSISNYQFSLLSLRNFTADWGPFESPWLAGQLRIEVRKT